MLKKAFANARARLAGLRKDEKGASLIEYTLLAALISIVAIISMTAVGTAVDGKMNTVATKITAAGAPAA